MAKYKTRSQCVTVEASDSANSGSATIKVQKNTASHTLRGTSSAAFMRLWNSVPTPIKPTHASVLAAKQKTKKTRADHVRGV